MQNYKLGEYIRQRRLDLGLTQEQVCLFFDRKSFWEDWIKDIQMTSEFKCWCKPFG